MSLASILDGQPSPANLLSWPDPGTKLLQMSLVFPTINISLSKVIKELSNTCLIEVSRNTTMIPLNQFNVPKQVLNIMPWVMERQAVFTIVGGESNPFGLIKIWPMLGVQKKLSKEVEESTPKLFQTNQMLNKQCTIIRMRLRVVKMVEMSSQRIRRSR